MVFFKPKIPIWENFGGSCNGRHWYIFWPFGLPHRQLGFLWPFGIFNGLLVHFFPLWYLNREKSGNPARESQQKTEKMFSFRET
jgi:hypothetical protein